VTASPFPLKDNGKLYDRAQVEEYLSTLFKHVDWEPGQVVSLLGIGEKGTTQEGVFRDRQIIPPAFMGVAHAHLIRWAEHHVAAFIVPAVLHASAQEKGDVTLDKVAALTAIILDIDSGDVGAKAKFAVERLGYPTLRIASGGSTAEGQAKLHLVWLLNEPSDEVVRVAGLRKLLAQKVGGDASFGRATQVIRIPGSVHAKNGVPALCSILEHSPVDYNLADLAEIIENMEPMPGLEPAQPTLPAVAPGGLMDFTPREDTAIAALHRDIHENGEDLTRFSEFSKVAGFNISEVRAGRLAPEAAYVAANGWMLEHMVPPWPQARFDTEFNALVRKDVQTHGPFPQSLTQMVAAVATAIEPTPASWPMASMIPPRPWLFGRWLQRGIVTAVIAPGGVGKSSLMAAMNLSMASGKEFLGKTVYGGPLRTWYWNLEDGGDNLARSRIAAAQHHCVTEAACGDRMFVDSGPEGATLCTAVEDRTGFMIIEPVMENITAAIQRLGIDVLTIDPFVSSHSVNENDNNKIDAVSKRWARVAQATGCAIVLVHHSVKMRGETVTADSSRGAGALNNAARMTLVLNRMSQEQAESWGLEPSIAPRYFSVADDKHNLSPAEGADWFELVSVDLRNATDVHESDSVGVVTRWAPPRVMDGVDSDHLFQIQRVLANGTYWRDAQSKDLWAGEVVGNIVGIDWGDAKEKARIKKMLDTWIKNGVLKMEMRRDEAKRRLREAVVVGHWVREQSADLTVYRGDED
jgi:hypothetical protein